MRLIFTFIFIALFFEGQLLQAQTCLNENEIIDPILQSETEKEILDVLNLSKDELHSDYSNLRPFKCKESKSPLFDNNTNLDIPIEIDLLANFKEIKSGDENNRKISNILMQYKDDIDKPNYVFGQIKTRGRSRAQCHDMPPLNLRFEEEKISLDIMNETKYEEEQLKEKMENEMSFFQKSFKKKIKSPTSEELEIAKQIKLKSSYDKYNTGGESEELGGKSQKNGLFSKTGKNIDIVTHCGAGAFGATELGKDFVETYDQKLLMEFYTYKILGVFGSTVSNVRLARVNYRDQDGKPINSDGGLTRYAFFKESKGKLAKRCNLKRGKGNKVNRLNEHFLNLQEMLIGNDDYDYDDSDDISNVIELTTNQGESYFSPYDFDRAAITIPKVPTSVGYAPNKRRLLWGNNDLKDVLEEDGRQKESISLSLLFLSKKKNIQSLITNSLLNEANKKWMNDWIDSQMKVIKSYLEAERTKNQILVESIENYFKSENTE